MKSNLYFRIMLPVILFLICGKLNAQHPSPPWEWAKTFYGTNALETEYPGPAIAVDPSNGAVYTTGYFFGTVADFDPGEGIFKLDSLGLYADMFISKLDDGGNFVWAKQISASPPGGTCRGFSIAVDTSGNGDIYTTGAFHGTVDFDPGPGSYTLLYSGFEFNNPDVFVSSLDSSGNFRWAAKMGGTGEAWGRSIVVDPEGEGAVYILGKFNGTIDFNPGAASYLLTTVGGYDFFIVKLDLLGNFVWAKSFGGKKDDIGFAMAVDPKFGDVYLAGDFTGQVNFNPDDSLHILTSGPNYDIFILKLDRNGNFVWVKPMFGTPNSKGGAAYAIVVEPGGNGDVYTTGYFEGKVDFNPDEKGFSYLESIGLNDVFISKLTSSGNFVWARSIGGYGDDKGSGIVCDHVGAGGVYILGNFEQTADLDPGQGTCQFASVHSNDFFISKLNSEGDFEWAKPIFAKNPNQNPNLAIDGQFLYMVGLYADPTVSFDSLVLINPNPGKYFWDVFIAKLNTTLTVSTSNVDAESKQILIYPNPSTNELNISIGSDESLTTGITMFNILGEMVFSSPLANRVHQKTIDISALSAGIYFMELNIDGKRMIEKVVKE